MMVLAIKWPPLRLEDILGQSQSVVSSLVVLDFLSSMELVFFVF